MSRVHPGVLGLVFALGCDGEAPVAPEAAGEPAATTPAASDGAGSSDAWDCEGSLVPPRGYIPETAFAADGNRDQATRRAKDALHARMCDPDMDCSGLDTLIQPWKTGRTADGQACTMAVVKSEELKQWLAERKTGSVLADSSSAAVVKVLPEPGGVAVAIGSVRVGDVEGGPLARWVAGFMERALSSAGAMVTTIPSAYDGDGKPDGIDAIADASIFTRSEAGRDVVEIRWELTRWGSAAQRTYADPIVIDRAGAPDVPDTTPAVAAVESPLSLHVSNPAGLSFCPGSVFNAYVNAERPVYARVFSLWDGGGLPVYPESGDGLVQPGTPVALGGDLGLRAVPLAGDTEFFAIVSADDPKKLDAFAQTGACRLSADLVQTLRTGRDLPQGVTLQRIGYTIETRDGCRAYDIDALEEQVAAVLEWPVCGPS